jgi:hypothetical protein
MAAAPDLKPAPVGSAPKKDRSPNYPALSFTDALKHAEAIWTKDKRNPMSTDMACRHLGYKAKNGACLPIIGAMKRYGLLINAGSELRVSDDAHKIFLAPKDHPERIALVKKLAMSPALFGEVLRKFPEGLPSDENLKFRLRADWEFATDKAAENFIKSLRDAVALAGVAPEHEDADNGSDDIAEEASMTQQVPAITPQVPQANRPLAPIPPANLQFQGRSWDLGDGVTVSIAVPPKLSKGNIAKLKKYVGALEMEASIAWEDDPEPV